VVLVGGVWLDLEIDNQNHHISAPQAFYYDGSEYSYTNETRGENNRKIKNRRRIPRPNTHLGMYTLHFVFYLYKYNAAAAQMWICVAVLFESEYAYQHEKRVDKNR